MPDEKVLAYKGFDKNLKCLGYQYAIGETFKHDSDVEVCGSGFHACNHPLDVFGYYPPGDSRFALVELAGEMIRKENGNTEIAVAEITIKAELKLPEFIKVAVDYVFARAKTVEGSASDDEQVAVSNTGAYGAASNTGRQGAASNTGPYGAASNTGTYGAASNTGAYGVASNTGDQGAASNTGAYGMASNTGDQGASSNTGTYGAAMSSGYGGKVLGSEGSALFLVERNNDLEITAVWAGIVGQDGIEPNVWYTLRDGKPVPADEAA